MVGECGAPVVPVGLASAGTCSSTLTDCLPRLPRSSAKNGALSAGGAANPCCRRSSRSPAFLHCCGSVSPLGCIASIPPLRPRRSRRLAILRGRSKKSTRRTIGQIDQILLSARAFYVAEGKRFDFNEWVRTQTLPDRMTAAIGMADSKGRVFADTSPILTPVSIADRAHFRAQIDPTRDELFISDPVRGRVQAGTPFNSRGSCWGLMESLPVSRCFRWIAKCSRCFTRL